MIYLKPNAGSSRNLYKAKNMFHRANLVHRDIVYKAQTNNWTYAQTRIVLEEEFRPLWDIAMNYIKENGWEYSKEFSK